ncbi:MAG: mRNA surveillance protein pelota [Candidatus Micrarchaeia archaeon]
MRVLFFDRKQETMKIVPETLEDLWHIENILEKDDKVSSSTMRTVKFGDTEEKKPVFITLGVEKTEFSKSLNRLRIFGKILSGTPEDFVQIGRHHTIDLEIGGKIEVQKHWKSFHLQRIKDAEKEASRPLVKIIAMDDEKAVTAVLRGYGLEYGPEFESSASKKSDDYESKTKKYYSEVYNYLKDSKEKIIIAGPGFAKENLKKYIDEKDPLLSKKIIFENCSYAEKTGILELLKRGVIEKVSGKQRIEQEERLIEEFILHLNKSLLVVYGVKEVQRALESRALAKLLILDELLRTDKAIQEIAESLKKSNCELFIISKDSDAGMKLKSFGGIAGFLRFSIN